MQGSDDERRRFGVNEEEYNRETVEVEDDKLSSEGEEGKKGTCEGVGLRGERDGWRKESNPGLLIDLTSRRRCLSFRAEMITSGSTAVCSAAVNASQRPSAGPGASLYCLWPRREVFSYHSRRVCGGAHVGPRYDVWAPRH